MNFRGRHLDEVAKKKKEFYGQNFMALPNVNLKFKGCPHAGCFRVCGCPLPGIELNNVYWFSIVSGPYKGVRVIAL